MRDISIRVPGPNARVINIGGRRSGRPPSAMDLALTQTAALPPVDRRAPRVPVAGPHRIRYRANLAEMAERQGGIDRLGSLGRLPAELRNQVYAHLPPMAASSASRAHPLIALELEHSLFVARFVHDAVSISSVEGIEAFESGLRTLLQSEWEAPLFALAMSAYVAGETAQAQAQLREAFVKLRDELPVAARGRLAAVPIDSGMKGLAATWKLATPRERQAMTVARARRIGVSFATARAYFEQRVLSSQTVDRDLSTGASARFLAGADQLGIESPHGLDLLNERLRQRAFHQD